MTARSRRLGCWPTPEQEQLLRAALLDGAEARAAWETWQGSVDIKRIDAGSARLLPLLFRNVARLGISSPLVQRLKNLHQQSWYKNQVLFQEVAKVITAFRASGIETMLLKGVPLAVLCYQDEGARPMADVDVLVKPADVQASVALLRRCGWQPEVEPRAWPVEPRAAWPFVDGEGRGLDLHWRALRSCYVPDDDLWAAAVPIAVRGAMTRALSSADQLLHVVVHGLAWNEVPSIRWVADAVFVVRSAGEAFGWDRLVEQAASRGVLLTLTRALDYLGDHFAVKISPAALERMRAVAPTPIERLALWSRMHPSVGAAGCRLWFDYVRYTRNGSDTLSPIGFLDYMRAFWQVADDRALPGIVVDKIRGRLKRLRAGRPAPRP